MTALKAPVEKATSGPNAAKISANGDIVRVISNGDCCAQRDVQSTKSTKSSELDLWDRALTKLQESEEDRDIISIVQEFAKKSTNDSVKDLAKNIKESMEQKINDQQIDQEQHGWKITIGQHKYSVREFVEKTVTILNKFVAVGDVAVSVDPVHAALPWAAVRFVLTVSGSGLYGVSYVGSELRSQIIFGLAKVTSLVLQCDMYRQLYMAPDPTLRRREDFLLPLETSIVQAYVKSLLFLGFAIQRQGGKNSVVSAPWKLGKMETELVIDIHQDTFLTKLRPVEDAAFDSHANEHDPRCHPDTRVDLLADIYEWADDPDGKCIYWLKGMAGTGKSTISRTVARKFADSGVLNASFLFKRGEGDRGKAARLFATIAIQLARQRRSLAQHIRNAIEADPGIAGKAMKEQFEKLITQPLEKMAGDSPNPLTVVIVVDAMDECDSDSDTQALIGLLPQTKQLISVRLKFFVTSRPEYLIRLKFSNISGTYQDLVLHQVDERVIENDISTFLKYELSRTRDDHNRLTSHDKPLSLDWPGQTNLQILTKMAIPLFIFAKTVCRFISDDKLGHPEKQLKKILEYQTRSHISKLDATYSPVLDRLVVDLSKSDKDDVIREFREVIGSIVVLSRPLSTACLSNLLRIDKEDIHNRLKLLHSVLDIPSDAKAPVKLFHLSFRDFLVDPKNRDENPFWVDEAKTHEKLTTNCIQLLSESDKLKKDICGLQMLGKHRIDIEKQTIENCLPPEVQYACLYWVYHMKGSQVMLHDGHQAYRFLQCHFLHWLEALSLIGRISESIGLIDELQTVVDPDNGASVTQFLHDAKRFILNCRAAIDQAPLQVYSSALIFAPKKAVIRERFQEYISWVEPKPIMEYNWNPCLQTLEGHGHWVTSVAFSGDGKLIASGSHDKTIRVWETATGALQQTLKGHGDSVTSVAFSGDGKLIASGSDDKTIRVWETATGALQQTLKGHGDSVTSVAFSGDGKLIASGSDDKTIRVWETATGALQQTLKGHGDSVTSVAFSGDG
ncbi:hypothetical protein ACHAPX_007283, partial [Trichoderma viride]